MMHDAWNMAHTKITVSELGSANVDMSYPWKKENDKIICLSQGIASPLPLWTMDLPPMLA